MENNQNLEAAFAQLMTEHLDYLARYNAFMKEHEFELNEMVQKAKDQNWDTKPVDPQEIFNAEALIKEIEDNDLEDDIAGFHSLKYSSDVHKQFQDLRNEGRYFDKRFKELELNFYKNSLAFMEEWLQNAHKAVLKKDYNEGLPEAIKEMGTNIAGLKGAMAVLELQVAAKQSTASN